MFGECSVLTVRPQAFPSQPLAQRIVPRAIGTASAVLLAQTGGCIVGDKVKVPTRAVIGAFIESRRRCGTHSTLSVVRPGHQDRIVPATSSSFGKGRHIGEATTMVFEIHEVSRSSQYLSRIEHGLLQASNARDHRSQRAVEHDICIHAISATAPGSQQLQTP